MTAVHADPGHAEPLLAVRDLSVVFPRRGGWPWQRPAPFRAVDGISLSIAPGETLGLVGESGSGKSTTARAVLHLLQATAGAIRVGDFDVTSFPKRAPMAFRRQVQAVFQDPLASLNPSMVVRDIMGEALTLHFGMKGAARTARVVELLEQVGLGLEHLQRYPYELSGGQRQRVSIARAIAVEPSLIVLDEPVSALDVSVQSQVMNLLEDLQRETGVAYLFVAHDLAVVRHASDRIAVMYHGKIVEEGPADLLCDHPQHPYTQVLLAAAPDPDPDRQAQKRQRRRQLLLASSSGSTSASTSQVGCPFAPRCPHQMEACLEAFPAWRSTSAGLHVACHWHAEDRSPV